MSSGSWLCPTELDRSRVVDASERARSIRRVGSGAVAAALVLSAPWIGWWTLGLFAASTLNFASVERRVHTSSHPERVSARGVIVTMLLLGGGIAYSGGPRSPMLSWLVLPAGMIAVRFRPAVVIAGLGLSTLTILAATLGVHPAWTLADPVPVIAVLALLVGVVAVVWALQGTELHHRDEAILDQLTGLLNRHALLPRFAEITQQARLTHQPVCLILADLDRFKDVNDCRGHDRGDAVLQAVAYEMRKQLRSFELIYRLGGEEFLILLPGIALESGEMLAERLREAIEEAYPAGVAVTISVGVSAASGERVDYDTLFRTADAALYEAKRAGRNRVVAAQPAGELQEPHSGTGARVSPEVIAGASS
ncbi:MAG: GGDEF domain-containing protein [Solirubrobacteraceae bacterium]